MSLRQQAITVATDEKYIATQQANNKTQERGARAAAWVTEQFGLDDAVWLSCERDTWYTPSTTTFGHRTWRAESQFRHRVRVDDVTFGLSYGRYGTATRPSLEVVYVPCPSCGIEHGASLGYVSTIRDAAEARATLLSKVGRAFTTQASCTRCAAQPCSGCGRPH